MTTSCRDCVFALFSGEEQSGCELNRLEKFPKKGVEVLTEDDDGLSHCVIQGLCLAHRHRGSPWAKKHPKAERALAVRAEIAVAYDAVVLADGGCTQDMVGATVASLLGQSRPPAAVRVVVNCDEVKAALIAPSLPEGCSAIDVLERDKDGRVGRGRCIDIAVADSHSAYYAVFSAGFAVPKDFGEALDRSVSDDLERFALLLPNAAGEGLTVQLAAHRYYGGNALAVVAEADGEGGRVDSVEEKVLHAARLEGLEWLARPVEEIIPSVITPPGKPGGFSGDA